MSTHCYKCMSEIADNATVCPKCGFDKSQYVVEPHHLVPGTVINSKYEIGAVIGEGGFGITYVGRDTVLDMKVAVKEFYMSGYVNRNNESTTIISVGTGTTASTFTKNREKFIEEARVLAKFANEDGVVGIRDYFQENNTAYIVMDFLEGTTLDRYIKNKGKLTWDELYKIMQPILKSLEVVHKSSIIHRDISPDNIMMTNDGKVKLLDFGAARAVSQQDIKSLSVILKPGYAPEEQYRSKGKQGAWTDVYALSATMYRCLTGKVPDDSMERMFDDKVVPPIDAGAQCSPAISNVIMKGMAVRQEDRYTSIAQMCYDISLAEKNPNDTSIAALKKSGNNFMAANGTNATLYSESIPQRPQPAQQNTSKPAQQTEILQTVQQNNAKPAQQNNAKAANEGKGKSGKKKTGLIIGIIAAAVVLVAVLVIVIAGSSGSSSGKEFPYGFTITINDYKYKIPCKLSEFQQNGWELEDPELINKTVEPNTTYGDMTTLTNGYGKLTIWIANLTESVRKYSEADIVGVTAGADFNYSTTPDSNRNTAVAAGGAKLDECTLSKFKSLYSGYSKNSTTYEYVSATNIEGPYPPENKYSFTFSSYDDILYVIAVTHYPDPETGADSYMKADPGIDLSALQSAVGFAPVIEITGEKFELLTYVKREGWIVEEAPEYLGSHSQDFVSFRSENNKNITVRAYAYNPTNDPLIIDYCIISGLSSTSNGVKNTNSTQDSTVTVTSALSPNAGNIKDGSTIEEVEAFFRSCNVKYTIDSDWCKAEGIGNVLVGKYSLTLDLDMREPIQSYCDSVQ